MKDITHFKLGSYKISIQLITFVLSIIGLVLTGYVFYDYRLLNHQLAVVEKSNLELNDELVDARDEIDYLLEVSNNKQATIDSFTGQIEGIASTVGVLNKLSQTDKELLKKYSKVYFLNENYVPAKLAQIEEMYSYNGGGVNFLVHAEVWPHLKNLLDDARTNIKELLVASAFRSFDTQASLKSEYKVIYGIGTANQFSADQGYSEHQLGTSIDFTTPAVGGVLSTFKSDPAYQWLKDNAHKYGFTLSYPEGNTYYKFEPWHWRFVGVDLAIFLHQEGKYFYDLDQREIDTYLIKLFD